MNTTQQPALSRGASWGRRGRTGIPWGRGAAVALTIAAVAAAVLALPTLLRPQPVETVTIGGILGDPGAYVGQRVVVSGRVEELLTHRALTLASTSSDRALLVLMDEPAVVNAYEQAADGGLSGYVPEAHGPLYREQTLVQLTGTIARFDRASLADRLDIVLDARLFSPYDGAPVLIVDQLDTSNLIGVSPIDAPPAGDAASAEPTP